MTTVTPQPRLDPLRPDDFAAVAAVAREIWHAHYASIISHGQIEYMLDGRFTPENLQRYVGASRRWMDVLRVADNVVGYCSCALTDTAGEMKLEQLYLLPALHGRGFGKLMLHHIEALARRNACDTLVLQVNKHNANTIAVYLRSGFTVRREAVTDIGQGYVMDDYIMEKRLQD